MTFGGIFMLKRFIAVILSFLLVVPFQSFAEQGNNDFYIEEEDDISIEEILDPVETETPAGVVNTDGSTVITVTCTGDFTIGGDNYHRKGKKFYDELKSHGNDINFTMEYMRDIFRDDDLTLVNFEGTLTDTKDVPDNKKGNDFLFNISPSYVSVLPDNYIEAVSLANNHVMDHGTEGFEETKATLKERGIKYSTEEEIGLFQVKGITIAMLSYLCIDRYDKPVGGYDNLYDKVAADIAETKKQFPIVIVSFHWGNELDYTPTERQKKMGHIAVDAGADLVIGHHSHRINPIEEYNGKYICYSLGNFCFSGNDKPKDMNSFVFQTRFKISKSGDISNIGFRIIPIRITSVKDRNNYTPKPITDDMKIDGIISTLLDNGKGFGVSEYPLEWK